MFCNTFERLTDLPLMGVAGVCMALRRDLSVVVVEMNVVEVEVVEEVVEVVVVVGVVSEVAVAA